MRDIGGAGEPAFARRRIRTSRGRRRLLVLLRGLNAAALGALVLDMRPGPLEAVASILLAILAVSSLLIALVPERVARAPRFQLAIGLADLALLALGIHMAGLSRGPLLPSCLLMIIVVTITADALHAACAAAAGSALHAWMATNGTGSLPGDFWMELLLLACVGTYYHALASRVRARRARGSRAAADQDADAMLTIQRLLDEIHAAPDLRAAAFAIVSRLAAIVPSVRCSLVCIDEKASRCWVLASHEDPGLPLIEVDLAEYPEMRRAIETRDPILIQDTLSDPLTRSVRERLEALDFHMIMVIPITWGRELMGLLCLRGAEGQERFGRREINLCTSVARATAGALRDALPRREVA